MADTIPNVIVAAKTVTDIYAATSIAVGTKIVVRMIGNGNGRLYAGATLTGKPTTATGYMPIYPKETHVNETGDAGAFIWSEQGCELNVKVAV